MQNRVQAALDAAASGIPVFPCRPGSREPLGRLAPRGVHDATTDPEVIRSWWSDEPDANIGGAVGAAGLAVLDVDGAEGFASLAALELMHGEIERSYTVETASGGLHIYMRCPPVKNRVRHLGPGLDVRSEGGYVLLPGSEAVSKETGELRPYTVSADCLHMPELSPVAPAWFPTLVGAARERSAPVEEAGTPASDTQVAKARAWLQRQPPAVEGEGGDAHTFETACRVRDFGLNREQALELMEEWNERCEPPWGDYELATKVRNAYVYSTEPPKMAADPLANPVFARVAASKRHKYAPLDWTAIQQMPPPEWLVEDLLPKQGLSMLAGPWGSYKSFIALAVALDVATGRDTLGLRGGETGEHEPAPVLYVAGEGAFGIRQRVAAYCERHGVRANEMANFHLVAAMPNLLDYEDAAEFVSQIAFDPALVIIDTLATAVPGADENSAQDMGRLVSVLGEMRDNWKCNVMVLHHFNSGGKQARGSTAIPGGMDTILTTEAEGLQLALAMTKQKDAARWEKPKTFKMHKTETPWGGSLAVAPAGGAVPNDVVKLAEVKQARELQERRDFEDARLKREALSILRATTETVGVTALAGAMAEQAGESAEYLREWLRSNRAKYSLKSAIVDMDKRGRPAYFRRPPEEA